MKQNYPAAKSQTQTGEREKVRGVVATRDLCGLANDTKWDELIIAMRKRESWRPSYRFKCVDGPPSEWDSEWIYHLPFPFISVEWFDIAFLEEIREHQLLSPKITDHSEWIEELLFNIGLDYIKGNKMIRIFGYSPRDMTFFDDKHAQPRP